MQRYLTILGLVAVGVMGRLLPHFPNATPITAITLAARKQVGAVWAFVIPTAAMLLSDAVIGFYDWKILFSVYISFLLIGCLSLLVQKNSHPLKIIILAIAASVLFFLVTNFAVWLFSPWYEKSISGLIYCYTLGIPFLRNMVIGDIAYTVTILGILEIPSVVRVKRHLNPTVQKVRAFL